MMNARPPSRALPAVTLTIAAAALLIAVAGFGRAIQFDRWAVFSGSLWQLLSCHLAHWSAEHLLWDVAGLLILGWWCEARSRSATLWCLAISSSAIGLGVWIFLPALNYYRGLSGLDSALFGLLVVMLIGDAIRQRGRRAALLPIAALALFAAKLGHELLSQSAVFVHTRGMVPVPLAHVLGLACGIITGIVHLAPAVGAADAGRPVCRESNILLGRPAPTGR